MKRYRNQEIHPTTRSSFRVVLACAVTALAVISLNVMNSQQIIRGMIEMRKQELRRLVTLGLNSVEPIRQDFREGRITREEALTGVRDTIRRMTFDDPETRNYLFMSAYDGTMLVQPFEPDKEGTDQWGLVDSRGTYIIRELVKQAREGEGFVRYYYIPPDRKKPELKISYVVGLDELSCYLGTGLYLHDVLAILHDVFWKNHLAVLVIFLLLGFLLVLFFRPYFLAYKLLQQRFNAVAREPDVPLVDMEHHFHPDSEVGVLMINFNDMLEELKNARDKIEKSLKDKEVLLQEIHHRVKNNLQIVSSLLNLQMGTLNDPEQRRVFQESALRINSMSLIHESIYSSHVYDGVEMSEYIRRVTSSVIRSTAPPDVFLKQDFRISQGLLSINQAILCGLILTELITNSMKHGFSGKNEGILTLVYEQTEKEVLLKVGDNGNGAPSDLLTRDTQSLGITLVKSLGSQLDGTVALDNSRGSCFSIVFPVLV